MTSWTRMREMVRVFWLLAACLIMQMGAFGLSKAHAGPIDLLVIAPEEFVSPLNALVAHKNATGLSAELATLESIYSTYSGVDEAEKVKRAIRSYKESSQVKYVMLVGDVDKFPVRWVTREEQNTPGQVSYYFPSDLYYADLYDASGAFCTWNSDGDAYFGEHLVSSSCATEPYSVNADRIDFHPDVAVGRVPASNIEEVRSYVAKVIRYEYLTAGAASDWFHNVLLLAGGGRSCDPGIHFNEILDSLGSAFSHESYIHSSYYAPDDDAPTRPCVCLPGESVVACVIRTRLAWDEIDIFYTATGDIGTRPDSAFENIGFLAYHNHTSTVADYRASVDNSGRFTVAFSDGCGDGAFAGDPPGGHGRFATQNLSYRTTGGQTLDVTFMDYDLDTDGDGDTEQYYDILDCVVDGTSYPLAGNQCGGGLFPSMTFASDFDASGTLVARSRPYILNAPPPATVQSGFDREFNPETKLFAKNATTADETGWVGLVAATKGASFPANGELEALFFRAYASPHATVGGRNRLGDMWRSMLEYWLEEVVFTGTGDFFLTDFLSKYEIDRDTWFNNYCANSIQHAMMYGLFGDPSLRVGGVSGYSDTDPPTTTSIDGMIFGGDGVVSIPFTATDNGDPASGVRETRYRIDSGPLSSGDHAAITVSGDPADDGYHTIAYYSVDFMGNQEAEQTAVIGIDTHPPRTSVLIDGSAPAMVFCPCYCLAGEPCECDCPERGCYIDSVLVTLNAVDPPSPIPTAPAEPADLWNQVFGGSAHDEAMAVEETPGGGFIVAGYTASSGAGERDAWLIKTDASGNRVWDRTYGGGDYDRAYAVGVTSDEGYALAGYTNSSGAGDNDAWLVKTDASGAESWTRTFGGADHDEARDMEVLPDGGFVLAGFTESFGTSGSSDAWLIRTNASGTQVWAYPYGGEHTEEAQAVARTADGGFVLAGVTTSFGAGGEDAYLVKTDTDGIQEWYATFGGAENDRAYDVQQTADGGYIVAGWTSSAGSDSLDLWLIKTDAAGHEDWSRVYGRSYLDSAHSVRQTADGGYVVAGYYTSSTYSAKDLWLIKTDADGLEEWSRTFGGSDEEYANAVRQTADGGYILAGRTQSYGAGGIDAWLLKVDIVEPPPPAVPIAGVNQTEYYLNTWDWMYIPSEYSVPFHVGHGTHTLYYRSEDNAGNWENYRQLSFCVNDLEGGLMREEARILAALEEIVAMRMRKDFASTLPIKSVLFQYAAAVGQGNPDWITLGTDANGADGWGMEWDTVAAKIPDGKYLIRMTAFGPGGLTGGLSTEEDQQIYQETLAVMVCNIPAYTYSFHLIAPPEVEHGGIIQYEIVFENKGEQSLFDLNLVCDLDPGLFEQIAVSDEGSQNDKGLPTWYRKELKKNELWKVRFMADLRKDILPGTVITGQGMITGASVVQLLSDNPATVKQRDSTAVTVKPLDGFIEGKVVENSRGAPLSAKVTVKGPESNTVFTDSKGQFSIEDLAPGVYSVSVSAPGYIYGSPAGPVTVLVDGTGDLEKMGFFMELRDVVPPVSTLGLSTDAIVEGNLTKVSGSAYDYMPGSGVDRVKLRVRRSMDQKYWDGTGWEAEETWLPAEGTAQWSCDLGPIKWDPKGSYTVSSRATDNAGNVERPEGDSTTAALPAPKLLLPEDTAVVFPGDLLQWSQVGDVYYRIQIDNHTDFGSPETDVAYLFDNTAEVPDMGQGVYYWRVKAMDSQKGYPESPWSEPRKFTIEAPEPPPCVGDFKGDGDVDGEDLAILAENPNLPALNAFADHYGRADCPAP